MCLSVSGKFVASATMLMSSFKPCIASGIYICFVSLLCRVPHVFLCQSLSLSFYTGPQYVASDLNCEFCLGAEQFMEGIQAYCGMHERIASAMLERQQISSSVRPRPLSTPGVSIRAWSSAHIHPAALCQSIAPGSPPRPTGRPIEA